MPAEQKHTITTQAEPPEGKPNLLAAHEKVDAVADQLRKMSPQPQGANGEVRKIDPDTLPMVALDSVLVATPNKLYVEVGPPPIATAFLVSQILSSGQQSEKTTGTILVIHDMNAVRALLYVRAINGQVINLPRSMADAVQLMNFLGDGGMDTVTLAIQKFWPSPTMEDLPVLKKNLRES